LEREIVNSSKRALSSPAVLVFLALTLGFATADFTNVRWLGGLVMLVIGSVAAWIMLSSSGLPRTIAAIGVAALGFVLSHPLGAILGSYGALFLVSIVVAAIVWILGSPRGNVR